MSHKEIYRRYAAHYELLVSRQDYAGNIERSIRELDVFHPDVDVVELGAGTGRLTRMVAPWVRSIHAFDSSSHMLDLARERMPPSTTTSCTTTFSVGNNREVHTFGLQPSSADVVLAGWTLSYVKAEVWSSLTWDVEVKRVLADLRALLRPHGSLVILETLGTGNEEPNRRNLFYALLEEAGFHFQWFRTDYRFVDWDEAIALTRFFFGNKVAGMAEERRVKQRRKKRSEEQEGSSESEERTKTKETTTEHDEQAKEAEVKEQEEEAKEEEEEEDTEEATLPECTGLWWIKGEDMKL